MEIRLVAKQSLAMFTSTSLTSRIGQAKPFPFCVFFVLVSHSLPDPDILANFLSMNQLIQVVGGRAFTMLQYNLHLSSFHLSPDLKKPY